MDKKKSVFGVKCVKDPFAISDEYEQVELHKGEIITFKFNLRGHNEFTLTYVAGEDFDSMKALADALVVGLDKHDGYEQVALVLRCNCEDSMAFYFFDKESNVIVYSSCPGNAAHPALAGELFPADVGDSGVLA